VKKFFEPKIIVSRCLGFEHCRYDGQIISSEEVQELKEHVDFMTICPECDIGLGVPRDSLRLISDDGEIRLVQPETGRDVTDEMKDFLDDLLSEKQDVDGFLLKSRSPSCGLKEVKIYSSVEGHAPEGQSAGIFGSMVLDRFPEKAIESEGRLRNHTIRQHFLTKIFTFANFRDIKRSEDIDRLGRFHENNRLLFRSYDEGSYRLMGDIYSKDEEVSEIFDLYEDALHDLFRSPAGCESRIKIMEDIYEEIKDGIGKEEKELFQDSLKDYNEGKTSLDVPLSILHSWLMRFEEEDMKNQSFFYPYPRDLVRLEDVKTCISKDYWYF